MATATRDPFLMTEGGMVWTQRSGDGTHVIGRGDQRLGSYVGEPATGYVVTYLDGTAVEAEFLSYAIRDLAAATPVAKPAKVAKPKARRGGSRPGERMVHSVYYLKPIDRDPKTGERIYSEPYRVWYSTDDNMHAGMKRLEARGWIVWAYL